MLLLQELSKYYNFTMNFIHLQGETYHQKLLNGLNHHHGYNKNISLDIMIGGFHLTEERSKHFSYSYPYFIDHTTIMTRQSERIYHQAEQFFEPFDQYIWLMICFLFGFIVVFDRLSSVLLVVDNNNNGNGHRRISSSSSSTSSSSSINDLPWIWIQILLRQPVKNLHYLRSSSLLITNIWLLFAFIITSSYAGCLLSLISIPKINIIDSLEELARHCRSNTITVLIERNTTSMRIIEVCPVHI